MPRTGRSLRPLLTADEVRRLGRDEAIVVVSNQRPIWTKRWWWNRDARQTTAYALGPARIAALPSPTAPPPPSSPPVPPKPTLGDLKAKLERLDDDQPEDLDDLGRDRYR